MRRGVWLVVLGVLVAALGAASARADGATGTTTTAASYAPLTPSYLPASCIGAGAAAIAAPNQKVLTLGTPASAVGPSGYPSTAPVVTFDSSAASGSTCRTANVTLQSVSLFGGAVTADSVAATAGKGTVTGLEIEGSPVTLGAGQSITVGFWGQLTLGKTVGRLNAPLVLLLLKRHFSLPPGTEIAIAFSASAELVAKPKPKAAHHGSSTSTQPGSGATTTTAGSSQSAPTKKQRHKKRHVPQPLTATPSLGYRPGHYVFPVNGGASYVDTYGANRSDIYDGWHHGDDLFAKLGTPVVAVATGTLSLVGWNELGGWRLWLTDGKGNSFYYAHLAGYSRWILDHPHVKAGEVLGFLGRTGDAFTTEPHLHFEIHPTLYLSLGYDGAVDPTTYLQKWHVEWVPAKEMPQPAKLKAPVGAPAQEAAVVWHELLAARHLLGTHDATAPDGPVTPEFPRRGIVVAAGGSPPRITDIRATSAQVPASTAVTTWVGGGTGGLALVALSTGAFFFRRRRRTSSETTG